MISVQRKDAVTSRENIFTVYTPLQGRRIFEEGECFLKIACINGKILASGKKDIIAWVRETFKDRSGAWFMDVEALHELEADLKCFTARLHRAHPFYIATEMSEVDTKDYEIRIFEGEELEPFRGDERFGEAFLFHELPKDEIGVELTEMASFLAWRALQATATACGRLELM